MFKISPKTIVLGGLAIAAAAGALKNRDKVAGLIGARSSAPEPPRPEPAPGPARTGTSGHESPAPSNYDLGGPAANTATKVPAPEVAVRDEDGGIDERAEEEAAAAEAAAIGGGVPEYPGLQADEEADDATRPLAEAGEGESEGEELAEFDLRDEAESRAGETSDAEQQVADAIEAQDNPALGESIEAVEASAPDAATEDDKLNAATADDADDAITSTAKDDDDPANDGVRETGGATGESPAPNGSGGESASTFGFAGGKVGGEEEPGSTGYAGGNTAPDEGSTGYGSTDVNTPSEEPVTDAAEAEAEGPEIHPDQTSLLDEPRETPAQEKSAAVWQPPQSPDAEKGDDDDDGGGSEWQTWSGRAIQ